MNVRRRVILGIVEWGLLSACSATFTANAGLKILPGHLPKAPADLASNGQLPATNRLRLAIGLPLRDAKGLDDFLAGVYDPANPDFRHYLTPDEFTTRFGPTAEDYQAVIDFARTNGLRVTATHGNRLVLDVEGSVENIQRAFHITMRTYPHPLEPRAFFAPDTEPSVDAQLPISDVSGLNNYLLPHPRSLQAAPSTGVTNRTTKTGSSSTGAYMGADFRAAYLPGTTLTGAGQMVGLVQFDGFYANDITAYESAAGLASVPIQTVLLDGYNGVPTTGANSGNGEVSLDIEMVMSMAPGLSRIIVFEAGPSGFPNDILSAMASSNQVKQFSCSWGWSGGPSTTTDNLFKQMASQGQSFFDASGDSDAFTAGISSANGVDNPSLDNAPSSSPYITVVGGTTLTTSGPGGSWSAETVWNWGLYNGSYVGSSGGISSYYTIPTWQANVSMAANGGSTSHRNVPDVALTADNVFVKYGNGSSGTFAGTSCAAPLWAGLTALINQQAAGAGRSSVGFLNPALYAIGESSGFNSDFHDITSGNNVSSSSPNLFYATTGYDLCTGWGTPAGQALINALAGAVNPLTIAPAIGFTSAGPVGGPFAPNSEALLLTNSGTSALTWSLVNTSAWLQVSSTAGTLAAGSATAISAGLTTAAYSLAPGNYNASLLVSNQGGGAFTFPAALKIGQSLVQNGGFETGDFTGWTLVGNTTGSGNIYNAVESSSSGYSVVHSGSYGAFLGDTQVATLSQALSTVPGQYYLLSLWFDNPTSGTVQQFILDWNTNGAANNPLFSMVNPPAFSWTNLQFLVCATGTNATLKIQAENDPSYFGLDDVSVTPIPSPAFKTSAKSAGSFQLSWTTTTGLTYQVQYKTNLLQTAWVNLSNPFVATNYSSIFLDTNALGFSPQRFYRLIVSP